MIPWVLKSRISQIFEPDTFEILVHRADDGLSSDGDLDIDHPVVTRPKAGEMEIDHPVVTRPKMSVTSLSTSDRLIEGPSKEGWLFKLTKTPAGRS